MEVVVDFLNLRQILILHLSPGLTLIARCARIGEQYLIDHDVPNINLLLSQLNGEPLRLIHGEELGDADGDECRLLWVLELLVYFLYFGLHLIKSLKNLILDLLRTLLRVGLAHDLRKHASELLF